MNCFTECSQKRCATGAIMRGKDIHREEAYKCDKSIRIGE